MTPFAPLIDTDAALAAHARMPAGERHYLLTDDEAEQDEIAAEREAMGRWHWHHELRRRRAESLGLTISQMRRMGGYQRALKALVG
jgi:FAD/FMN-containing dehydrogenase